MIRRQMIFNFCKCIYAFQNNITKSQIKFYTMKDKVSILDTIENDLFLKSSLLKIQIKINQQTKRCFNLYLPQIKQLVAGNDLDRKDVKILFNFKKNNVIFQDQNDIPLELPQSQWNKIIKQIRNLLPLFYGLEAKNRENLYKKIEQMDQFHQVNQILKSFDSDKYII